MLVMLNIEIKETMMIQHSSISNFRR